MLISNLIASRKLFHVDQNSNMIGYILDYYTAFGCLLSEKNGMNKIYMNIFGTGVGGWIRTTCWESRVDVA